jgi:hypothetical protein
MGRVVKTNTRRGAPHTGPLGIQMQARCTEQVHIFISATPAEMRKHRVSATHGAKTAATERAFCVSRARILNFRRLSCSLMEIYFILLPKQTAGSFPGGSRRCHGKMRDDPKNANLLLLFLRVCRRFFFALAYNEENC